MKKLKRGNENWDKKAQVFGMPFSVIFSLFLIAVFLVVAFFAIRHFLGIKKCSDIGLFVDDFQSEIDNAWKSQSSSKIFKSSLPSAVEYVCFANLNEKASGSSMEKEIYAELRKNADFNSNLFFYPQKATKGCIKSVNIEHVNIIGNPYCISVENGKIEIKIERGFYDALVKVERA